MQLKDKVIIITGGCQGLGRAMAEYLAAKGARLALVDLNPEKLELAVAACQAQGVEARAYLCNVADEEQVTQTVARIAEDFGAINGLVNNAGILRDGLLLKVKDGVMTKMSLAQWQAVIDVNLTGVFLCTREVAAKMIELNSQGAIINISSISRAGNVGQTNYSAAKAGVAAATVTWAKELSRYGIGARGQRRARHDLPRLGVVLRCGCTGTQARADLPHAIGGDRPAFGHESHAVDSGVVEGRQGNVAHHRGRQHTIHAIERRDRACIQRQYAVCQPFHRLVITDQLCPLGQRRGTTA